MEFRFGGEEDGMEGEGRGGIVRCVGVVCCRIKEGVCLYYLTDTFEVV